jgi:iron complex transport system substrate-binding protein
LKWSVSFCLFCFFALSFHSKGLSLTDDLGRLIDVDEPPKTIVSLSPHLTELLFDLDVGHRVVGTVSFSDYPNLAKSIPRIGDASTLNLERIIQMEPDLVIAWLSGGSFQSVELLIGLGLKVYVNEISTPRDIASSAEKLGVLVGQKKRGLELSYKFSEKIIGIQESRIEIRAPSVFFQLGEADLFTFSRRHFLGKAIEICGAKNVFSNAPERVPRVSFESVLKKNPDFIIFSGKSSDTLTASRKKWQEIGWSHKFRFVDTSELFLPSLRFVIGLEKLCSAIHEP